MSKSFFSAAVVVAALAFSSVPVSLSAAESAAKATVSPASAKALKAVQDAANGKRFGDVITRAEEALKIPAKTPYDTFVAYQFLTVAYQGQGNKPAMLTAMQGQLDSGYPSAAEQNQIIKNMTGIAYELKNYPQVVEYGNRLIHNGAADEAMYGLIGHSMFLQGKYADSSKFLNDYVVEQEHHGQKPREATLSTLRAAYDKQGNHAGVADTLEKLVLYYPNPDYWAQVLYSQSRAGKLSERQTLQLYRLKLATQTLKRCFDFTDMAETAINVGIPAEGKRVIDQAVASKVCTEKVDLDKLQRLLGSANREIAVEKAGLAKLEANARTSPTGELDVTLGSSLFGYGEFPKSAEALTRGIGKGGLKYLADAQLLLGIVQIRAGNKADAIKTFQSIKTDEPSQRLAKLWVLYAK